MVEPQQLQQRLQISKEQQSFNFVRRMGHQAAAEGEVDRLLGSRQILIELSFLFGQAEGDPLVENPVMVVA